MCTLGEIVHCTEYACFSRATDEINARTYALTHARTHTRARTHAHTDTPHTHIRTHTQARKHTRAHTRTRTHTRTNTHTHTHIQTLITPRYLVPSSRGRLQVPVTVLPLHLSRFFTVVRRLPRYIPVMAFMSSIQRIY